jgi:hypothetical protein
MREMGAKGKGSSQDGSNVRREEAASTGPTHPLLGLSVQHETVDTEVCPKIKASQAGHVQLAGLKCLITRQFHIC